MTDREPYDLADLRERIQAYLEFGNRRNALPVDADELLALIDAVEAARAFEPLPDRWANGDERNRLREALARFTHTEP